MSRIYFKQIQRSDDDAIASGLEPIPVPGDIEICFENKPSFYDSIQIRGRDNQIIAAVDNVTERICGIAVRSTRDVYINGRINKFGYLSNLRINPGERSGRILARGYEKLKQLHDEDDTELYASTIVSGNIVAMGLLTSGRCGLPHYNHYGQYYTAAVNLLGKKRKVEIPANIELCRGTVELLDLIVGCLNRNGREKQFFPVYRRSDFEGDKALHGMTVDNFFVAKKHGDVIGVVACWDQSPFKQLRVTKYCWKMKILRPIFNMFSGLLNITPLPATGSLLKQFFAGFIAVDNDDQETFKALLTTVYNEKLKSKFNYFAIGFHTDDPLLDVVKSFPHTPYMSEMLIVNWPEQQVVYDSLEKKRIPYLETGML